jgi:hypothetical protein
VVSASIRISVCCPEGASILPARGNALGSSFVISSFSAQRANTSRQNRSNGWPVGPDRKPAISRVSERASDLTAHGTPRATLHAPSGYTEGPLYLVFTCCRSSMSSTHSSTKPQPAHIYRATFTARGNTIDPAAGMLLPPPNNPTVPGTRTMSRDPHFGQVVVFRISSFLPLRCETASGFTFLFALSLESTRSPAPFPPGFSHPTKSRRSRRKSARC